MKKIMSILTAFAMLWTCMGITAVTAASPEYVTADKTAQWKNNSDDGTYDLRVHGWKGWETAAYIGFTLPEDFDAASVKKAELVVTTKSGSNTGTAYIYSADYDAFENGGQYTGSEAAPSYNTTEFGTLTTSVTAGEEVKIDVTSAIQTISGNTAAFRIDVKSQNTSNKWVIGSCTNDIQAPRLVFTTEAVELDKHELLLKTDGNSEMLTAEIIGAYTDDDLEWSSSDESIASVKNGFVTPHKAGATDITVSVKDTELSDICKVTVAQSAEGIEISQKSITLCAGGAYGELSASVLPENVYNKRVIWTSDNTDVAEVSQNGIVTPVAVGTANISVSTEDGGFSAVCAVTVTEKINAESISLDKTEITLDKLGSTAQLTAILEPTGATADVEWKSSDESVARVIDGTVISENPGEAVITAAIDGGFSTSCRVTVTERDDLITNDRFWQATDGSNIYSQGGGIYKFGDKYYWYGAEYAGADSYATAPENGGVYNETTKVFKGFTCYSSTDLINWDFEGYAMTADEVDAGISWVGRMGVAYNQKTQKYVLVSQKYPGIMFASSDTPEGPFVFEKQLEDVSYIKNGSTGDQTVFVDDDGEGYLICSSCNGRQYLYVIPLTDDYDLDSTNMKTVYYGATKNYLDENGDVQTKDDNGTEGDCMFKYNGHYYFTGSDLYGWNSSRVYVFESDSILGDYNIQPIGENQNLPYIMRNVAKNFAHNTQAGFYVTVHGSEKETVIYCGDRWADFAGNGLGYNQWVPLSFDENGAPYFNNLSQWSFNAETGEWTVGGGNNYAVNPDFEADRWTVANPVGWTVSDNIDGGAQALTELKSDKPIYGTYTLKQYSADDYEATVKQTVSDLPDGTYTLRARVKSSGGQNISELYAQTADERYTYSLKSEIGEWTEVVIPNIIVSDGECEIGLYSDAYSGNWVLLDNLFFTKNTEKDINNSYDMVLLDDNGQPVETLTSGTIVYASASALEEDMTIIMALYTDTGVLEKAVTASEVSSDSGKIATEKITLPEVLDGRYIKLFAWSDLDGMTPLIDSVVIK